jgi:hypothetical protein
MDVGPVFFQEICFTISSPSESSLCLDSPATVLQKSTHDNVLLPNQENSHWGGRSFVVKLAYTHMNLHEQ